MAIKLCAHITGILRINPMHWFQLGLQERWGGRLREGIMVHECWVWFISSMNIGLVMVHL